MAEGEPQRVPRGLLVAAHREQHVRGLGHAGRAGRAGGALDAAGVEQHQQRVALAAGEAEVGVAREPVDAGGSSAPPCRCASGTTSMTRRTRSSRRAADPRGVLGLLLDRELDGGREAGDRRRVDGAAADVALLAAAVHQRRSARARGARASAPTPYGPPSLCAVRVSASTPVVGEVDRHRADRLDGVGVHRDAVRGGERDDLLDRLQGADLVVGPHHRDQRDRRGVALDRLPERLDVEPAAASTGSSSTSAPSASRSQPAGRGRRGARPRRPGCGSGAGRRHAATRRGP